MPADELPMDLPIIDLDVFLNNPQDSPESKAECLKAANALITYGALVLHDSRVSEEDNTTFLDLLEDYFAQPREDLQKDERPELSYQIGVTLENTEKPKCAVDEPCLDVIARLAPEERPLDISAHSPDPKCRFFWRMNDAPPPEVNTQFPGLNAANVAGKQLEYITGGLVKAGFHEVVINEATIAAMKRRTEEHPDRPLIRISSTMFYHLSSDYDLAPLPALAEKAKQVRAQQFNLGKDEGAEVEYPPTKVGFQVQSELKHIALMA
ncbi:hypothetical protein VdG1_00122 [Verticillium dahliae VDG1]|nr:hypothetical protein VdG1_00122 [Verticillium dahliae VDG1]